MASRLHSYLIELHQCCPNDAQSGNGRRSSEIAAQIAGNIRTALKNELDNTEIVRAVARLFNAQSGILQFLQITAAYNEFQECRTLLLDCLSWLFECKVGTKALQVATIQSHAETMKNVLLNLYNRDKSAKTKISVVLILIRLLQSFAGTSTVELLKPEEIFEKFFMELNNSKITSTVLQQIYHLLGIIAQMYPERVENIMERLLIVYLTQLKKQIRSATKTPNFPVITGCLCGLNALLQSYPHSVRDYADEIYEYTAEITQFKTEYSRYDCVRAGFALFNSQAVLFKTNLYKDNAKIYSSLEKWISARSGGQDVTNTVYSALDVFLRLISDVLCTEAESETGKQEAVSIFNTYMERFSARIKSGSLSRDVAASIKGYGYFSRPCRVIYGKIQVKAMFQIAVPCCERIFYSESEMVNDKMRHLPDFIEALASIIDNMDGVSEVFLLSLENMVVRLIEYFPRSHPTRHFTSYRSIVKMFFSLYKRGNVCKPFVSKVVYHGLLITCSHPVVVESFGRGSQTDDVALISIDEHDFKKISYKNYMELWRNILENVNVKQFNVLGIALDHRQAVTEAVYNAIILSILNILNKLNFTASRQSVKSVSSVDGGEMSEPTSDLSKGLVAAKPKDFQIFVNVVDFSRDLLANKHLALFEKWVYKFGYDVIFLSTRHPLVSGFYKLLAVCFKICSRINYFQNISDSTDTGSSNDRVASYKLFSKYILEVIARLHQYKEDLLISCVEAVLSSPSELISEQIKVIVPVVETTLKLGLSYQPIIKEGLSALERWNSQLPKDVLLTLYKRILPLLNSYLIAPTDTNGESSLQVVNVKVEKKTRLSKMPIKVMKKPVVEETMTEAVLIKNRIIELLGQLGNEMNHFLIDSDLEKVAHSAIAWDYTRKHLKFDVPFSDMKPAIYLDCFLPYAVELSSSTNRQTKIAASELLHSLVLFMLGTTANKTPEMQLKEPMTKLYERILPVLLKLACDVDQVVRQLFEPLVLQMIHWFSGNREYDSADKEALLNALLDGVSNDTDSSLRDFCAACVQEFLVWSIKQTTIKEQKRNPFNIKALLKRLYHLSLHPSSSLRLGAALTFNRIYVVFREEESLVNSFILELLVNFVESLALSQRDDQHLGTSEQCKEALNHIERILIVKATLFNKTEKNRRLPRDFEKGDLNEIVVWLLRQCGRVEVECRQKCMNLATNLAPHIKGISSVGVFFEKLFEAHGIEFFITLFEGEVGKDTDRCSRRSLKLCSTIVPRDGERFTITAESWFQLLLATLDSYIWVFSMKLIEPSHVFTDNSSSVLMKCLRYFVEEIALKDFDAFRATNSDNETIDVLTPRELDVFNHSRCTTIVRTMNFVQVVLADTNFAKEMLPCSFWNLLVTCTLQPTSLGFNVADTEVMMALPNETVNLYDTLTKNVSCRDILNELHRTVASDIRGENRPRMNLFDQLNELAGKHVTWTSPLTQLVSGYEQLQTASILIPALELEKNVDHADMANKLLLVVSEMCCELRGEDVYASDLEGARLAVAGKLLQLSFSFDLLFEALIDHITNSETIRNAAGSSTLRRGDHFFTTFKVEIAEHIEKRAPHSVDCTINCLKGDSKLLSNVVLAVLSHLASVNRQRKMFGTLVVDEVLANFSKLAPLWSGNADNESKNMAFLILRKILIIDAKVARSTEHFAFLAVFDMYLNMLVDSKTSLQFKGRLLDLLQFFTSLPEDKLLQLKKHLVIMTSNNFPMKSSELSEGSLELAVYREVFFKFLNSLVMSGSVMILELLIELICPEPSVSTEKRLVAISMAFQLFASDVADNVRQCALERVCIPLLQHADKVTVQNFFVANIREIMSTLQEKPAKVGGPKFQSQLIAKTCCFKLVELLYLRGTREELNTQQSLVNSAFCESSAGPRTGRELTQEITKVGHGVKKENMCGETVLLELRRLCRCAAYNAVASVIMCTQTEVKIYAAFLFTENVAKGDFLWDNLVDQNKAYNFQIEFNDPLETRERLVGLRRAVRRHASIDENSNDAYGSFPLSLHALTERNLCGSSLSEDVSQFDFTSSPQNSSSFNAISTEKAAKPVAAANDNIKTAEEDEEVLNLEMDELNKHECMAPLCALLHQLSTLSLAKETTETEMPSWMKNLCLKFSNKNCCKNVKLFIAKLIINSPDVFRSYAKHWLYPLMELIVSGDCGHGMNYFVIDVVVLMLSWSLQATPSDAIEREMASKLLSHLVNNAFYERPSVLNHNLEVIKTLVECWRNCLEIPTRIIYDNLTDRSKESKCNIVGIKLLGIGLTCGLPPYTPVIGVDETNFFRALAYNMGFSKKEIYTNAAEVLGLAMKQVAVDRGSSEMFLHEIAQKELEKLDKEKGDRFLTCLYRIQKNYPAIVNSFLRRVLFLLPNQYGIFQTFCLEIILAQVSQIENVYIEMKRAGLKEMLHHGNDAVKLLWLQVFDKMLQKMTTVQILEILPSVVAFVDHPMRECRRVMFESLFWIYDNFRDDVCDDGASILAVCRDVLLQGLADKDETLRLIVLNFWGHDTRLNSATLKRSVAIVRDLYSPGSERNFLSYATYLLLEMTSKSPDYNRKLFEHPLSDCQFHNYRVNTSWRARHSSMVPLFVDSLVSAEPLSTEGDDDPMLGGHLRATQEQYDFTATQDTTKAKPFNWLTQGTLDTTQSLITDDSSVPSTSANRFNIGASPKKMPSSARTYKPVGRNFGRTVIKASNDVADGEQFKAGEEVRDLTLLKRRFLKDRESMKYKFAAVKARQEQRHVQQRQEQKIAREAKVTLYRQYRTGDLPDIQIAHSSIIAPLQALAQADDAVAKTLFTSLLFGVLSEAKQLLSEEQYNDIMDQMGTALNRVVSETKLYYPPVISLVQELCYEHCNEFKLPVDGLTSASLTSLQQNTAILLLEKTIMLASENTEPRNAKRARKSVSSEAPETRMMWFKLAELNKSQGNADIAREIFAHKVGCHKLTCEALEAEMRGDYLSALDLYKKAYQLKVADEDLVDQTEYDLWDDSLLQCYAELTQWDKLAGHAVKSFDGSAIPNLHKVWDELYYQDHYLPHVMTGKLRTIMQGTMDQSLNNFVDATLNDLEHPERKQLLESNHSEELAVLSIIQSHYNQAHVYRTLCIQRFLHDWTTMSGLDLVHRRSRLCDLQKLVEMQQFLAVANLDGNHFENRVFALVKKWEQNCPNSLGSLSCINDIVEYRCMYLKLFELKAENVANSLAVKHCIQQSKLSLLLSAADAAAYQSNFSVALLRLKDSREFVNRTNDRTYKVKWCQAYVKTHLQRSETKDDHSCVMALLNVWKQLEKYKEDKCLQECPSLHLEHHVLQSRTSDRLSSVILGGHDSITDAQLFEISRNVNCATPTDRNEVMNSLVKYSFVQLNKAVGCATAGIGTSAAFAHLQLVNFCDKHLRKAEEDDDGSELVPNVMSEFPKVVIENLLDAIRLGNDDAVQLFPRLFQLIEVFPKNISIFQNKIREVPCWMLIRWISQIVALLDKPIAPALQELIIEIAKQYPQALVYPFKVSSKGYCFGSSAAERKNKATTEKIKTLLDRLWLIHQFVDALDELKHPVVDYKQYHNQIGVLLRRKDKPACKKAFQQMYQELFVSPLVVNTDSALQVGKFRKLFATTFRETIEDIYGEDGSKLVNMCSQVYQNNQRNIFEEIRKLPQPRMLKEYCDWLCAFQSREFNMELEIPGQYSGLRKPLPQYHTKVAKFDNKVQVLQSIQCPKAITIYGNDYKTYKFLVKGGEDLRLDQRIEQLFQVMNEIFNRDAAAASRQLKLATYQVIPLTDRLGLLEWVENTTTLADFLLQAVSDKEKPQFQRARDSIYKWISKLPKSKSTLVQMYDALYLHPKWDEVLARYENAVASLPRHMLKNAFLNLSSSLESFLTLRNHFIASHGVLCIAQYVLGIGDRHLSNFMVSLNTGGMVGIDFGHAFGSATQLLPIPELMPFRLTPQFLNLMEPFREHGLLQSTMNHALSALRKNPVVLLNTMDVFIKEPSLDWKEAALKEMNQEMDDDVDVSWYPRQKVTFAKRKLTGHNSRNIMVDELNLRTLKTKAHKRIIEVCSGLNTRSHRRTAANSSDVLSVEDQVSALLDHATDVNILSTTYFGWSPFA